MRDRACGDELLEGGLCAFEEALAGLGQADTARCAYEERCADARLKCAYRLAHGRWSHAEFRGRFAKTAVLGNAQERLYAVERALPDCEVPLHNPSTLSRIVDRGKRSYIQLANPQSRRTSGVTLMSKPKMRDNQGSSAMRDATLSRRDMLRAVGALTV